MRNLLLVLFFPGVLSAQQISKGKVLDEKGDPLPFVSISINDTTTAVSDSAGAYTIIHDLPFTAKFSLVGYTATVVKITGSDVPSVSMFPLIVSLPETVFNSFERNGSNRNLPASAVVLNRQAIDRFGLPGFVPAMNTVPGVKMDERSPGSYRISIRGNLIRSTFGVRNIKVYWNGIPFTDASGNTYFNQLAFNNIGTIEVLKGPSGSMYGSGTGGVILLGSNISSVKERTVVLQATGGSYGMVATSAAVNVHDGNKNTSLSFSHQQSGGYRRQSKTRRDVANFTGTYYVNNKQQVNANIFYSDLYYQTPGGLNFSEMNTAPRQARPAAGIFKSAETQKAALYLKTIYGGFSNKFQFNNRWNNTTSVLLSHTNFKNPTIRNYEIKTEQGIGLRTITKYSRGRLSAVFGAEYQNGFINTSTFGNNAGNVDTLQYHDQIGSRQFNIFAQADIPLLPFLLFNAGISYNNFHYGFERLSDLPASDESSNFTPQYVPRFALLAKAKFISLYVAVSKGYSPPTIDEVHAGDGNFNRGLKAEHAWNFEAGMKSALFNNKLMVDATYYLLHLQNTIVSRRDASGADYFVNAGNTKQAGLELSASLHAINRSTGFLHMLKCWVNYTNIHARFDNYTQGTIKYDGNKLAGTPPNVITAGLDAGLAFGVYTNITYNYTDQVPVNDANSFYGTQYNLLFIKLGWKQRVSKKIEGDIFVSWQRAFNEPYSLGNDLNAAGNRFYNPASPQDFFGGFTLKFIY